MGNYRFSMAPNISVPRSRFHMPFNHVTSFNHGKLIPIDCFEILPGDEFKCDFSAIIRMSTPIAPIFGNIKAHVHAFFVPMRLVWEHTKEFYGENKTSAGYQTQQYQIPANDYGTLSYPDVNSVSHYLGKPCVQDNTGDVSLSVLKERGYYLIWNEYYRAQQLQGPVLLNVSDSGLIGSIQAGNNDYSTLTTINFGTLPMNVCKEFDYFTACTTMPQYGSAVTLPLGTTAPIITASSMHNMGSTSLQFGSSSSGFGSAGVLGVTSAGAVQKGANGAGTIGGTVTYSNLMADLSNATAASINSIRYAFSCQKWLERANFGSRFFEMLNLHYGVTSPDARLQRPEYLGGKEFYINIDQVVSTADYSASSSQKVGQTGAISVTGVKGSNLFHKAFVEPGYVYVLISTTHERSYSQGILREDTRSDRFDFYFPEFANLGDQAVLNKEIYFQDSGISIEDGVFGYQEHWAEYRYRPNRISGLMDPALANSLSFWNLGENFANLPTLNNSFIMEDRNALTRCLVSGASGPDYIGDFYFDYIATREMPLYTIPGLIDHFGTM